MKKLKLQKALLAICLALATTLKISNEINAMKTNGSTIQQNSHANGPKHAKTIKDTFAYHLHQYIREKQLDVPLTPADYKELLEGYIQDDITKLITLTILLNFNQLPTAITSENLEYIDTNTIFQVLKNDIQKPQISKFIQYLKAIHKKLGENATNAEKIILSLCVPAKMQIKNLTQAEKEIRQLIEAYTTEQDKTVCTHDSIHQNVLSGLDSIAQLLYLEKKDPHTDDSNNKIGRLEQIVREFSKAYKNKLKKQAQKLQQQQTTQPGNEKNGNIDIKGIEKLIQKWIQQKDKTNTEKEAKLKKLEQDITSLEQKYDKIVKGNEVNL